MTLVDRGGLFGLVHGVVAQLPQLHLAFDEVVLGRHAHPLASGHGDAAGDGAGEAGEAHHGVVDPAGREAEDQRHVRDQSVVHAEDGGAGQSAGHRPMAVMCFARTHGAMVPPRCHHGDRGGAG